MDRQEFEEQILKGVAFYSLEEFETDVHYLVKCIRESGVIDDIDSV